MNADEIDFVLDCIGFERRVFRYFRNRYAFQMLERLVGNGSTVAETKLSDLGSFLKKPVIREHLGKYGQRELFPELFTSAWIEPVLPFVISFGFWRGKAGGWSQVSRSGINLVLQLNFCGQHMKEFRRLYKPTEVRSLNCYGHPVRRNSDIETARETLAWARIDLDLDTGEALIEEIQTDWCRRAQRALRWARWTRRAAKGQRDLPRELCCAGLPQDVEEYVLVVLKPYADCWDEAMLAAAITFIRGELGIRTIFYHSAESGAKMKRIRHYYPPRSLYSTLPIRFGFKKTQEVPDFLMEDRSFRRLYKAIKPVTMHRLCLPA